MNTWHNKLSEWFFQQEHSNLDWHLSLVVDAVLLIFVLVGAYFAYLAVRKIVTGIISRVIKKTRNIWDDELLNSQLFNWIALLVPAVIILHAAPHAIVTHHDGVPLFSGFIQTSAKVFIIILSFLAANSLLNILERIYSRFEVSRELPVKSFFQVIKIILVLAAIIFIISTLIGKSPVLIFSGLGAMTAIMMLIFKDSILGLVAGIQLSANRMVARGDWIEMPKFGADGEVLEVALTTVKVRNWDKTITTIPTYALISDSFKNWRGMDNSGVRRIKRSVSIDMSTVEFLDQTDIDRLKSITLIKHYLTEKQQEIETWNTEHAEPTNHINARALSNLGTFRAYIREYLKNHPKISENETLLVRQLQPTAHGIPIEIYVFTTDNAWVKFEDIQSDLFDHFLSVLPAFRLRAFQSPSDHSFLPSDQ
ncbi:MAG: mechanosensitive ion channel family protein [Verrucomicrobiae bacterium]|nr:mechanosensitive ion channel family protein [Verrucomicrobiae bacterium]NNJ43291.1 mechanosensitive ion channel family protein [Akkermansiaceae bacterium]